jgi:uncharacterized damage-inducible protein DinB
MTSERGPYTPVDAFRNRWHHVQQMTVSFAEAVPDRCWELSPHPGFAPFDKQLRHLVCVRGVYTEALRTGRVDFSRKHEHYSGGLARQALLEALEVKHLELISMLDSLAATLDAPAIDLFGRSITPADLAYTCVQHEAIHHGQWSLYAAHGGFPVPELWRIQWGLGAGEV